MIEVIYKDDSLKNDERSGERKNLRGRLFEEKSPAQVKLPKNVTQIGTGGDGKVKIYIENEVITKIQEPCNNGEIRYGVLVGNKEEDEERQYIFVREYVEIPVKPENVIVFNDDVWLKVYEDIKSNNIDGDIVGWYATFPAGRISIGRLSESEVPGVMNYIGNRSSEHLKKLHLDNFAGINKILFCHEDEGEDNIYIYNNGVMERQSVYYVYWGKSATSKAGATKEENSKKPYEKSLMNKGNEGLKNKKTDNSSGEEKDSMDMKKMPWGSVAVIAVLLGILAFMGNSGMLSGITNRAKSVIGNIKEEGTSMLQNETPVIQNIGKGNITTTPPQDNTNSDEQTSVNNEKETPSADIAPADNNIKENETTKENETSKKNNREETTEVSVTVKGEEYIVKAGETLYDISRKFYNSIDMVKEIIELNDIENPDIIYEGQKLILPEK